MSGWPSRGPRGAAEAPGFATALRGGAPRRRRGPRDADQPGRWRGWYRPATPWSTPAFAAVLVTIALVGLAHRLPRPQWWSPPGSGAAARPARRPRRWRSIEWLAGDDAGRRGGGLPPARRARSRCAPTSSRGVLPTGTDLRSTSRPGRSWAGSGWLTLLPPVDAARPGAGPALAGRAARRRAHPRCRPALEQRAAHALVAPLVLLAGSIALGTSEPAAKLVQGVGFAVVLVGWLVVRAHRSRPPVQNGAGSRARVATGAVLVALAVGAGVLAGPLLPGTNADDRREVVRTALVPPLDVSQFPSPLPGFRRYTEPNTARALRRGRAQGGRAAGRGARAVRHPRRLRRPGLGRGRPQHRRRAVPAGRLPHRPARRRHPGRRHGRRRRRRVLRATGCRRSARPPASSSTARAPRSSPPSCGSTPTPTPRSCRARLLGGERYTMSALLPPAPAAELPEDLDVASGGVVVAGPRPARRPPRLLDQPGRGRVGQAAGGRRPDAHRGHLHRRRHPQQLREGLPPRPRDGPAEPVRQLHQAGRQRRAVRRHPGAGRAAARHPVAGRHGGRARAERRGARPRRARLGRGAARRRVVVPAAGQHLRAEPRQDAERAAAEVRGAEGRRPGAPAGRGQPALACSRGPTRRRTPPTSPSARSRRSTWAPGRGGSSCSCWASCCRCCCWPGTCCWCGGSRLAAGSRHASTGAVPARAAWVWRDLVAQARSLGVRVPRRATRREQALVIDAALATVATVPDAAPATPRRPSRAGIRVDRRRGGGRRGLRHRGR